MVHESVGSDSIQLRYMLSECALEVALHHQNKIPHSFPSKYEQTQIILPIYKNGMGTGSTACLVNNYRKYYLQEKQS